MKYITIYTPYITKGGKKIYASQYGKKVFKIKIREDKYKPRK